MHTYEYMIHACSLIHNYLCLVVKSSSGDKKSGLFLIISTLILRHAALDPSSATGFCLLLSRLRQVTSSPAACLGWASGGDCGGEPDLAAAAPCRPPPPGAHAPRPPGSAPTCTPRCRIPGLLCANEQACQRSTPVNQDTSQLRAC